MQFDENVRSLRNLKGDGDQSLVQVRVVVQVRELAEVLALALVQVLAPELAWAQVLAQVLALVPPQRAAKQAQAARQAKVGPPLSLLDSAPVDSLQVLGQPSSLARTMRQTLPQVRPELPLDVDWPVRQQLTRPTNPPRRAWTRPLAEAERLWLRESPNRHPQSPQ